MRLRFVNYAIVIIGLVPLIFWCFQYIDYSLWYDEAYSLEHFVLTDFSNTLFYYPAPNNHIFFNLTSQIISRIAGLRDVVSFTDNIVVFRTFQALIAIATACFSMRIIKDHFNYKNYALAGVILFTTIPFMNFALQLRGYNMSSLFVVILVFYSWNYLKQPSFKAQLMLFICSILLLYTIPSNVYILFGYWLILLGGWLYLFRRNPAKSKRFFKSLWPIAAGVVVAVLLYAPILNEVIFNKFSSAEAPGLFYSAGIFLEVLPSFFSKRYALLLLLIPGLYYFRKQASTQQKKYFLILGLLFVLPFAISFLHQKSPFPRVFIGLVPVFCLMGTVLIVQIVEHWKLLRSLVIQGFVLLYCGITFIAEAKNNAKEVSEAMLEHRELKQGLYQNYYLGEFFQQEKTIQEFKNVYNGEVVFTSFDLDQPSTELYLRKYEIPFENLKSVSQLRKALSQHEYVYVLTTKPWQVMAFLDEFDGLQHQEILNADSFTHVLKVQLPNVNYPLK